MTFDEVYPDLASHKFIWTETMRIGDIKYVTEEVFQSWRVSFCVVCNRNTTWRYVEPAQVPPEEIQVMAPICGPECLAVFLTEREEEEIVPEQLDTKP